MAARKLRYHQCAGSWVPAHRMFNWRWANRIGHRDPTRTAYLRSYDAPSHFAFPEKFDLAANSLLLTESLRGGTGTCVLLYWTSEERCRALEPVVVKALGISNPQEVGQLVQVLTPAMPRWTENPAKWGKWLISAAALFGALTIIRDNFTELFAAPDVVIFSGNAATPNFHAGDPLDIPMVVRNQARLGHVDVHLRSAKLSPVNVAGAGVDLKFDISELPQLQAGQQIPDVHVSGSAPSIPAGQPQAYLLQVDADSKEGFFRCSRKAASHSFAVKVWPNCGSTLAWTKISPSIARVRIDLWPGIAAPAGLKADVSFKSKVVPEKDGIIAMADTVLIGDPTIVSNPAQTQGKIPFQIGALQAFRRYSYDISISFARQLTSDEWNFFSSNLAVHLE